MKRLNYSLTTKTAVLDEVFGLLFHNEKE